MCMKKNCVSTEYKIYFCLFRLRKHGEELGDFKYMHFLLKNQ